MKRQATVQGTDNLLAMALYPRFGAPRRAEDLTSVGRGLHGERGQMKHSTVCQGDCAGVESSREMQRPV